MEQPFYEKIFETSQLGITLVFRTTPGGYSPLHWHEEVELLYPLNGEADITVEGQKYKLQKKNVTVVESCKIHSSYAYDKTSMFLCIHFSKEHLQSYFPHITLCQIQCVPDFIDTESFTEYYKICELCAELTRLYISDASAFRLEAEGLILQIIARLTRYFSSDAMPNLSSNDLLIIDRIRKIITYVEQHYQENISLQDAADLLGVTKEYFCRLFRKNMGLSFLQYVNEVRLSHIYSDLQSTDLPISAIMEKNGFSNQKLFNRSFKKIYGCTPSAVRHTK